MKQVTIAINNCFRCPHNKETHILAPNSDTQYLSECGLNGRLIQSPDEEYGAFPEWCPLPDVKE